MSYRLTAFTFCDDLSLMVTIVALRAQAALERGDRTQSSEAGAEGDECLRNLRPYSSQHCLCTMKCSAPYC